MAAFSQLAICTEAHTQIGMGHFMRCLALAEAWQEAGGCVLFLMPSPPPRVVEIISQKNMGLKVLGKQFEPKEILAAAQEAQSEWLVLDSYAILPQHQAAYQTSGLKLLWLDDTGSAEPIFADLVLNPHLYADASLYPGAKSPEQLLLGPRYLLFRREFRRLDWPCYKNRDLASTQTKGLQIVLFMGGTDPVQSNFLLLDLFAAWFENNRDSGLSVQVITTGLNPQLSKLQSHVRQMPFPCQIALEPSNLIALLQASDLAITTPSGSAWELLQLKCPLATLTVTDHQMALAESLHQKGWAPSLGDIRQTPSDQIFAQLQAVLAQHTAIQRRHRPSLGIELEGKSLERPDGQGVERILQKMGVTPFRLRPMTLEDVRIYWEMSNDPLVRAMSFHSEPIPWESHLTWLRSKLAQTQHFFSLVLDERDIPAGVLRFEPSCETNQAINTGIVGILLAEHVRGRGWAAEVLKAGIARIWWLTDWQQIRAQIKPTNPASIRAFTQAGFESLPSAKELNAPTAQEQSDIPVTLYITRPERIPMYHAD